MQLGSFFNLAIQISIDSAKNAAIAESAGYKVLTAYTLPKEAWVEGYYDILEPRAKALLDHQDSSFRDFAG